MFSLYILKRDSLCSRLALSPLIFLRTICILVTASEEPNKSSNDPVLLPENGVHYPEADVHESHGNRDMADLREIRPRSYRLRSSAVSHFDRKEVSALFTHQQVAILLRAAVCINIGRTFTNNAHKSEGTFPSDGPFPFSLAFSPRRMGFPQCLCTPQGQS